MDCFAIRAIPHRPKGQCIPRKIDEKITPLRNPSEGIFIDVFIELANQKIAEKSASNYAQAIQDTAKLFLGDPSYTPSSAEQVLLNAKITDFFNRTKNLPATNAITTQMIDSVTASLQSGSKTIIIAHSQGNMFANAILASVTANQPASIFNGLKIVSVANPAASAQDGRYITANQDIVIEMERLQSFLTLLLPPLPNNIDLTGCISFDLLCHGILDAYLNPSLNGIDSFVTMVENAINAALCPVQIAGACPDTFTQTQLNKVQPGMTVAQVDAIFGCSGRNLGVSNWYIWYNDQSLTSFTLNTAYIYFANGIYLSGANKSLTGDILP
jgi:hypothetical protein